MTVLVAGLGRRGSDCVAQIDQGDSRYQVVYLDTDQSDLSRRRPEQCIVLGGQIPAEEWTRNDISFSFRAAMGDRERVEAVIATAQAVIVVAGLGGGTGAGGAHAVASIAKELEIPVVAVLTHPFTLEGEARRVRARQGFREIRNTADLTISFHQDQILPFTERFTRLRDTVSVVDQCVVDAVEGLASLLAGLPKDAEVRTVLSRHREGLASFGIADRPAAAGRAAELALANPFLSGVPWDRAEAIWLSVSSRQELDVGALNQARAVVANQLGGRDIAVEVRSHLAPENTHPLHLRLFALGDLGQPHPPMGDFFVPGPTG